MRYIITQGQLHQVVYKYLDGIFENSSSEKKQNPYNPVAYNIELKTPKRADTISYFYYGPGTYDDDYDTEHSGIGTLHVHPNIIDDLRRLIKTRETKVMDMVADWFSEKYEVDIDEVSIYPNRKTPPVY
jgi:hypothetical protein